ncbi:hypothetical protein SAMN02745146_3241 [Hymenobacter daecheongensis DSM 21074]|uniref:Transcription elongation factor n=1 Tax=Hymenobacter daecheongensis DSM 21074 TaxID=1121955 RepID=A0A1M6JRU0_9BACT|nr:hypothetical protein [Hymenobacter daecheongensis]SHJ49362.1 hypothetical protein SAMN02745146_3241 [Hymenobacter daecheongensis DSM 21074]
MPTQQRTTLRQQLLAECCRIQQLKADNARQAMLEVQESANEGQGAIEDMFESFRAACQIQRDLFARQLDEALLGLRVLQRIPAVQPHPEQPNLGTIIITDTQRFFIALSLGEITVAGEVYCVISAFSPLYLAMASRRVGDTFAFRDKKYCIKSIV